MSDEVIFTVNPKELAHCEFCYTPMYCIYDRKLRRACYECGIEMLIEQAREIVDEIYPAPSKRQGNFSID